MSSSNQFINIALYPKKDSAENIAGPWNVKAAANDVPGLNCDVTDTTGFAAIQRWKLNGTDFMYLGTVLGFNGFVNEKSNDFFFGNANGLYYILLNTSGGGINFAVNGVVYTITNTELAIGSLDITTTGRLTDGVTPINSGHDHTGTGNNGKVIPHATTSYTVTGGSPQRSLNTTYTNNSGRVLFFFFYFTVSDSGTGNGIGYVDCKSDGSSPPTTIVQKVGHIARLNTSAQVSFTFSFMVQPSMRYRINSTSSSSTLTLNRWLETAI